MKKQSLAVSLFLLAILLVNGQVFASMTIQEQPETVAESSQFKATSTSKQVEDFVIECAEKAEHVRHIVFGKTVEGRDMVAAVVASEPYELGQEDQRAVALVIGNIHSGECAAKKLVDVAA